MTNRSLCRTKEWATTAVWTLVVGLAFLVAMIGGLGLALLATFAVVFGPNG